MEQIHFWRCWVTQQNSTPVWILHCKLHWNEHQLEALLLYYAQSIVQTTLLRCWAAKNKLQMCSVTQHQCRRHLMCGKCSHIEWITLTFGLLQRKTCHHWTIYSWQSFNSLVCPLMLKTNYRCVQSLNISVDVAKCVENFQTLINYTHFWTVTKKDLS